MNCIYLSILKLTHKHYIKAKDARTSEQKGHGNEIKKLKKIPIYH